MYRVDRKSEENQRKRQGMFVRFLNWGSDDVSVSVDVVSRLRILDSQAKDCFERALPEVLLCGSTRSAYKAIRELMRRQLGALELESKERLVSYHIEFDDADRDTCYLYRTEASVFNAIDSWVSKPCLAISANTLRSLMMINSIGGEESSDSDGLSDLTRVLYNLEQKISADDSQNERDLGTRREFIELWRTNVDRLCFFYSYENALARIVSVYSPRR